LQLSKIFSSYFCLFLGLLNLVSVDLITDESKRATPRDEVNLFAKAINAAAVIETSSKTGAMVDDVFQQIAKNWVIDRKDTDGKTTETGVELGLDEVKGGVCSC